MELLAREYFKGFFLIGTIQACLQNFYMSTWYLAGQASTLDGYAASITPGLQQNTLLRGNHHYGEEKYCIH
ncbi:hypothetical protein JOC33_001748 [Thalassobacillus pellis]|nr:hypothetical protein [Thalassobacillus pellis]